MVVVVANVVVGATVELGDRGVVVDGGGSVLVAEVPEVHALIRAMATIPAKRPGRTT